MKEYQLDDADRKFMKANGLSESMMRFFIFLYRRERIYKWTIIALFIALISLSAMLLSKM